MAAGAAIGIELAAVARHETGRSRCDGQLDPRRSDLCLASAEDKLGVHAAAAPPAAGGVGQQPEQE